MPKIVFVAGLNETGCGTIMDMVMEGSRKRLGSHIRVGFEENELKKIGGMVTEDTRKAVANLYRNIETRIAAALKRKSSVVVEGPLTLSTEDGYIPLLPKRFFESFKPDVFIVFESIDGKSPEIDLMQQEINRAYAAMYAALGNSVLKIIKVGKGGVKGALRECTRIIEYFLAG